MTTESYIQHGTGGTSFVGGDAVALYQAIALGSALRTYAKTKMLMNRSWTIGNMLDTATRITKKPYKRGDALTAADDLKAWSDAMRAAMPVC